jgi:hypothetical protein
MTDSQLAQLCVRLSSPADPLSTDGPMRALALRVAARVRSGVPVTDLEVDLDRLDDLLLEAGYAAGLSPDRVPYAGLPGGLGDGHPVLAVLACPLASCARVELAAAVCTVSGQPLRRVIL